MTRLLGTGQVPCWRFSDMTVGEGVSKAYIAHTDGCCPVSVDSRLTDIVERYSHAGLHGDAAMRCRWPWTQTVSQPPLWFIAAMKAPTSRCDTGIERRDTSWRRILTV